MYAYNILTQLFSLPSQNIVTISSGQCQQTDCGAWGFVAEGRPPFFFLQTRSSLLSLPKPHSPSHAYQPPRLKAWSGLNRQTQTCIWHLLLFLTTGQHICSSIFERIHIKRTTSVNYKSQASLSRMFVGSKLLLQNITRINFTINFVNNPLSYFHNSE